MTRREGMSRSLSGVKYRCSVAAPLQSGPVSAVRIIIKEFLNFPIGLFLAWDLSIYNIRKLSYPYSAIGWQRPGCFGKERTMNIDIFGCNILSGQRRVAISFYKSWSCIINLVKYYISPEWNSLRLATEEERRTTKDKHFKYSTLCEGPPE